MSKNKNFCKKYFNRQFSKKIINIITWTPFKLFDTIFIMLKSRKYEWIGGTI